MKRWLALALVMWGCGDKPSTDFGGGGPCANGSDPAKDTANPIVAAEAGKALDTVRFASYNMSVGFPVAQLLFINMKNDTIAYKALDTLHARYLQGKPSARIRQAAQAIASLNLDVVGLQEVETLSRDGVLQNDFLAELLADIKALNGVEYQARYVRLNDTVMQGGSGAKVIVVHFSEGNAVLVKPGIAIVDSAHVKYFAENLFPLSDSMRVGRGYDYLRLRTAKGAQLQVYNTHLEDFSEYARSQASELKRIIACARLPGHAQAVLGDLNADAGNDAHAILLEDSFYDTHGLLSDTSGSTCCLANSELWNPAADWSNRRIDFILAKGITKVISKGTALAAPDSSGVFASDHRMLHAAVELQ